jgi:hypothetical protein
MDQSDIKYIIELLLDAKLTTEWDTVEEAIESLKEFLDEDFSVDPDNV